MNIQEILYRTKASLEFTCFLANGFKESAMTILFVSDPIVGGEEGWRKAMAERLPDIPFKLSTEIYDKEEIEFVLCFRAQPGLFAGMRNLKAILATGAGVDGLFLDPDLPDVPIARIVDPWMADQMAAWTTYAVLHFFRRFGDYHKQQISAEWRELEPPQSAPPRVGFLGYGAIGSTVGKALGNFGFEVSAWTRGYRELPGVSHYHGMKALPEFMAKANFLVCLMPLTLETNGFLNKERLGLLPNPAYLINLARGQVAVTEDIIAALQCGRLAGAFLDVTDPEPLPADSPLWSMDNVRITPHCSGPTNPETAADQVAGNILRSLKGDRLENLIRRELGY